MKFTRRNFMKLFSKGISVIVGDRLIPGFVKPKELEIEQNDTESVSEDNGEEQILDPTERVIEVYCNGTRDGSMTGGYFTLPQSDSPHIEQQGTFVL